MNRMVLKLTLLTGTAVAAPILLAQDSPQSMHNQRPSETELVAWTNMQNPEPVPSRPVPLPDQQPEQHPDPHQPNRQQPASGQYDTQKPQNAAQTFAGTIMKSGDKYVLKSADNITYQLDDQARAKEFEGKQVQVTGSLDTNSGTIHVQNIKTAA